jgi:hypothetical protein
MEIKNTDWYLKKATEINNVRSEIHDLRFKMDRNYRKQLSRTSIWEAIDATIDVIFGLKPILKKIITKI